MAFTYSTAIQDRISLDVFGVLYATLTTPQKTHIDGVWTSGSLTTGKAFDSLTQIMQVANWFEMAGGTSAPQVWEPWLVAQTAAELAPVYRPERVGALNAAKESAIDQAIDSFTITAPTGAFASSNSSQAITVQGIRYFVLNHCARRKESGTNTGLRRRLFPPIDEVDSHIQWVLNFVYNKEHWSFRKRDVTLTINTLSTVTGATWTESSKTLTQSGAFTNLLLTNGPAMLMVTGGTGAQTAIYPIASKTSANAIVLPTSLSNTNADLATGDITAVLFFLDFRGILSGETIDSVASRRFYYTTDPFTGGKLNWIDATGMDAAMAYHALNTGQPSLFRIENQPVQVRVWRLAPFPDQTYTLKGSVYVSGPGSPSSVSDTTIFDKFPTEFGVVIRDMVLARVLQANNTSDADRFWSRAIENVQLLLPTFVDNGSPARLTSTEDVYSDSTRLIGNSIMWGGAGGFGSVGGLT